MVDRGSRIGVLMGGLSTERSVSLKTGAAVAQALRSRGWDVVEVQVGRDLPARLIEAGVDVAWIALHGRFGEDGCVQGLLEVMGIPYTGSGVRASAVAMDKLATKRALASDPTVVMATDHVVRRGEAVPEGIELPVVVKPLVGGSTIGISIAGTAEELSVGVKEALELHPEVLLEAFVEGEEITVAVVDGRALPVVRIVPESGFFDFEAKYTEGRTRYEVPAEIDPGVAAAAQRAAEAAYRGLGCRGLARADFIVPTDGAPVFLEINTLPGMTATSLSPMAASAEGVSFEELVEHVLNGASCMTAGIG
ncbi:MAG TPA: D-alanine--D-alanine ligase [Deltaproteobacteria bacterium]|nr:D-alanine--D-alanine ligase [Deltaproteobacteria bacterium]